MHIYIILISIIVSLCFCRLCTCLKTSPSLSYKVTYIELRPTLIIQNKLPSKYVI